MVSDYVSDDIRRRLSVSFTTRLAGLRPGAADLIGLRPHAAGPLSNGSRLSMFCFPRGSRSLLDQSWELLRWFRVALGDSWVGLGVSFGCSGSFLERSLGLSGRSWVALVRSWASRSGFGCSSDGLRPVFDRSWPR